MLRHPHVPVGSSWSPNGTGDAISRLKSLAALIARQHQRPLLWPATRQSCRQGWMQRWFPQTSNIPKSKYATFSQSESKQFLDYVFCRDFFKPANSQKLLYGVLISGVLLIKRFPSSTIFTPGFPSGHHGALWWVPEDIQTNDLQTMPHITTLAKGTRFNIVVNASLSWIT